MTALPGTPDGTPDGQPTAPTTKGFILRVLVWVLYLAIAAAILIPIGNSLLILAAPLALMIAGIGRALLGIRDSWLNIVAIPVTAGAALALVFAPQMLTITTGERVPFTVGEFTDTARCTLKEVGGGRTVEDMPCNDGPGNNWTEGSEVEVYLDGVVTNTMDDGTPWEADRLERNFSFVLPLLVVSALAGLAMRTVKVHRTYWRQTS